VLVSGNTIQQQLEKWNCKNALVFRILFLTLTSPEDC
jgi:hypothetical protein